MKIEKQHSIFAKSNRIPGVVVAYLVEFAEQYKGKNAVETEHGELLSHNAYLQAILSDSLDGCKVQIRAINDDRYLGGGCWVHGKFTGLLAASDGKTKLVIC